MSYHNNMVKEVAEYNVLRIEAVADTGISDMDYLRFYIDGKMKSELPVKSNTGEVVKTAAGIYHKDYIDGKYSILAQDWRKLQPVKIDDGLVDICNNLLKKLRENEGYPHRSEFTS